MNKEEYFRWKGVPGLITGKSLSNQANRVLIHGYTTKRETFTAVLIDGDIEVYIDEAEVGVVRNQDYVPDKRAYVEQCDAEFCLLLRDAGEYITFTEVPEGWRNK